MNRLLFFKITSLVLAIAMSSGLSECFAEEAMEKMFVCKNADFANKYWWYLNKKIPLNQKMDREYIDKMYESLIHDKEEVRDPQKDQCIWIEGKELSFFASDGYGTLAVTDGMHDVWFKNKASFGWINSQFYSYLKRNYSIN